MPALTPATPLTLHGAAPAPPPPPRDTSRDMLPVYFQPALMDAAMARAAETLGPIETPALDAWREAVRDGRRTVDTRDALWAAAAHEAWLPGLAWDVGHYSRMSDDYRAYGDRELARVFDHEAADAVRAYYATQAAARVALLGEMAA